MKTQFLFLGIMISCCISSAQAQQDSVKLYLKTDQLFAAINMQEAYANAINTSVEQQITTTPTLASYREDLRSFFNKWLGWSVLKTEIANLYLKYYTPEEMDAMIKFYQTPAGKKTATASANIQKELQTMQQSRLNAHLSEWDQFISGKTKP
jgi:hypothetical protein